MITQTSQSRYRKTLILLYDTDLILANVIKTKFWKEAGWETYVAASFEDGIEKCKEKDFSLILTEIITNDSRGKTGIDFIQEIQAVNKSVKPVIAVFTELGLDDDIERAKVAGADHYFVKSKISLNDLMGKIKNIIV